MSVSTRWPHTPTRLSDLIDPETLSILISGCCARLGRAIAILDYDKSSNGVARIAPYLEWQNFEPFCRLLRDEARVQGGDGACERCDTQRAERALRSWREACGAGVDAYHCHMGLADFSQVICVHGAPVGVMLAGQFGPPENQERIRREVQAIADGRRPEITFVEPAAGQELTRLVDGLKPAPADFADRFAREGALIQRAAEAYYQEQKTTQELQFLDELRAARRFDGAASLEQVFANTEALLRMIQSYCSCDFLVFFTNVGETDTVLTPLAQVGIPAHLASNLPHFNWTKAGLRDATAGESRWFLARGEPALERGVRGEYASRLGSATCAVASRLGSAYRAVLLFGPFAELEQPSVEQSFLFQLGRIVGWSVYAQIQALRLCNERDRLEATTALMQHRFKTALTPIATHMGGARLRLERRPFDSALRVIIDQVKAAHELALQLGRSTRDTARSAVVMVERDDLKFDRYPLSVLVGNCAEGFMQKATEKNRELIVEPTIESLPAADVDIARFTIAISNLLDNAVKYSYPSTRIYVRAVLPSAGDPHHVTLQIQDLGDEIPLEKRASIFERGQRGLAEAKMGKIPGTGYGLWEARAIVEAHGGTLSAKSEETTIHLRQGRAHRVPSRCAYRCGR